MQRIFAVIFLSVLLTIGGCATVQSKVATVRETVRTKIGEHYADDDTRFDVITHIIADVMAVGFFIFMVNNLLQSDDDGPSGGGDGSPDPRPRCRPDQDWRYENCRL